MKGDFSRSTFDPHKHYTSVRMQQGRVQLDADWNEQADILLHDLRTRFQDLAGTRLADGNGGAGPRDQIGFAIHIQPDGEPGTGWREGRRFPALEIGPGRYYVGGILCESSQWIPFTDQPDYPGAALPVATIRDADYLFYLDVWERHITGSDDLDLREPALGDLDTTTRTKTVWQVKWLRIPRRPAQESVLPPEWEEQWAKHVARAKDRPTLSARWQPGSMDLDNQLYRVEIHSIDNKRVTFKWSRENGSVALRLTHLESKKDQAERPRLIAEVEGLRDLALLRRGDWVEIVDDTTVLNGTSRQLCQVLEPPERVDRIVRVVLSVPQPPQGGTAPSRDLAVEEAEPRLVDAEMALEEAEPPPDDAETALEEAEPPPDDAEMALEEAEPSPDDVERVLEEAEPRLVDAEIALEVAEPRLVDAEMALEEAEPSPDDAEMALEVVELRLVDAEISVTEARLPLKEDELRQRHAILRRWDHGKPPKTAEATPDGTTEGALAEGALVVVPIEKRAETWLHLERGIEVCFGAAGEFCVGDYWLIPARAQMKKGILWPENEPFRPPHGIDHHYAPLALLQSKEQGWQVHDLRREFDSLTRVRERLEDLHGQIVELGTRLEQEIVELGAHLEQEIARVRELADRAGRLQTYKSRNVSRGDVVALDRNQMDCVVPANRDNAALVVGVAFRVYEREGGSCSEVAHYGRASCKVIGDVAPGNLLVASAEPGFAENGGWYLQPGTIIGKALSSTVFDEGMRTGTVDVLVTLS